MQFVELPVQRVPGGARTAAADLVAVEEPLEIRVDDRSVSITMRTPGNDPELAAGFLFTEGILTSPAQIKKVFSCGGGNVVRVELADGVSLDLGRLERHFYATSSCGVCGKASLDALAVGGLRAPPRETPKLSPEIIHQLPDRLRASQLVFEKTGGLHAAALFDAAGELQLVREDVGRHNAVDKLIGARFLEGKTPLSENVLLVSGRASFELMQKAVAAGIPVLAAVGAPSSLAVDLAKKFDLTLLGFVRGERFNIYHGEWRLL